MAESLQSPTGTGKARWTRLATLGFGLAAASPLIMLVAGAAFGLDLSDATFLAIPLVVFTIVTVLVWRFGTWSKIVGIVLGLLGALALFWLIFGLFIPGNFFDFVPALLYIPGVLLGVISCVAAIIANRRGHLTPAAVGGEARGIRIVLAVVAALAVLSGILTVLGRESADATGADAQIAMKEFDFETETITIAGGSRVYLDNNDPFFHTFTVKELDIDEGFTVGSAKLIDIPTKPGTYVFYCTPHSDSDSPDPDDEDQMAGRITVT